MSKSDDPEAPGPSQWDALVLAERGSAVRFAVHARPRSSRAAILGVREGGLDIAITAPPADGQANAELIQVLARALSVRRGDVSIVIGASGRSKLVEVSGIRADEARARLVSGARR
jgi:uncharacterized protein (TIGR00251 family)